MMKRLLILALLATTMLGVVAGVSAQSERLGPISQAVIDRGELICGVNSELVGFGLVYDACEYFDLVVYFCRAVAAAILGDATKVLCRPLVADDCQAAIQSGNIDLMIRNTS